jgi:methylamine dehydrogenase accessory protein MauD
MQALTFAVAILFLALITLAVAFLALARQVGVLFERISPMGALVSEMGPKVGDQSAAFRVDSLTGGEIAIGTPAARSTLVFFLSPTCPICKKLLPTLRSVRAGERQWLDVVLASDGDPAAHFRFIEDAKLHSFPYVLSTELGLNYRVARLPFAVLLDTAGVIRSKGLVNNREQLESLFNAQDLKVGSIQQFLEQSSEILGQS